MKFFSGLHWYEWLLVGVVVASLAVTKVIWDKYDTQSKTLSGVTSQNEVLSETVNYQTESATITDSVVTSFVQEKIDEKDKLDKSREGVINEYINMAGRPAFDTPVVNYPAPPVTARPKEIQARPTEQQVDAVSTEHRLGVLADRLHEHYCKAAPVRGSNCVAVGADK